MASKKISDLLQYTSPVNTDYLIVETAEGTRKITYENLMKLIDSRITAITPANNAAAHNGIFRGKDLTNIYTIDEICQRISNGTFEDLYIGDYFDITISTTYTENEIVRCVLAGFDMYLNIGSSTEVLGHHAVIVLKNCFSKGAAMNPTDTTVGGFFGSDMWKTILPTYQTALQSVLGNHILEYQTRVTSAIDENLNSNAGCGLKGASTKCAVIDTYISLLSEIQVYGSNVLNSSFYDIGYDCLQLPLFALDLTAKTSGKGNSNKSWYWLKNVASTSNFATIGCFGDAQSGNASLELGVRPLFLIG